MPRIAVLITCHNRREMTLTCLAALCANAVPRDVVLETILVDDGSTDGTTAAVSVSYPTVTILQGDGHLYWTKGMHLAFAHAIKTGYDAYLWLNDDTFLDTGAITRLVEIWKEEHLTQNSRAIFVGSVRDPNTGQLTYGGLNPISPWRPLKLLAVFPGEEPRECTTMNGNCVLIPHAVVETLGNLDSRFAHAMGDIDYGLRARQAGMKIWIVPGFVGKCRSNENPEPWRNPHLQFHEVFHRIVSPKGLPPRSWLLLVRKHGGMFWPVYWVSPYLKALLRKNNSN